MSMFTRSRAISHISSEPLFDQVFAQVPHVQIYAPVDAASLVDLRLLRTRHNIARRELHQVRRILRHEALAVLVQQVGALTARALGDQHPRALQRRRVDLHHLHVHDRGAHPIRLGDAVPVQISAFVDGSYTRPRPPVQTIVAFAVMACSSPVRMFMATRAAALALVHNQARHEPLLRSCASPGRCSASSTARTARAASPVP